MKKLPLGHVTVWQMTEEERLAYIAKHPIKPVSDDEKPHYRPDYKWRSQKGAESRWGENETDELQ